MTALESMGTGLVRVVFRLLSSLCHDTEGRGSPEAWHSRLMGSPTLTRRGPTGVTMAPGDSDSTNIQYLATGGNPSFKIHDWNITFNKQRHYGLSDAKRIARHTAVGSVVCWASVDDGDNGAIRVNSDVIYREQTETKHYTGDSTGWKHTRNPKRRHLETIVGINGKRIEFR